MLNRILALIYKELLMIWRDKKSRAIIIIPPIVQLFIFTFAATLDVKNVPIGIVREDVGHESFALINRFLGSTFFTHIVDLKSKAEIAPFIDNMQGPVVIAFDAQFSRNIKNHKNASVQLILDGRKSNTAQIVAGYITTIVEQYNEELQAHGKTSSSVLVHRNWFNPNLLYYWYNIPCLCGILTMVVATLLTALSVAREKELGTFDQMLISPATPLEIIIGKTFPAILIGLMEGSIIFLVGTMIFKVPFTGSIVLFFFSLVIFLLSIIGIGLFLSTLARTQQQAVLGSFIFMSPSIILSGFATPIENMPIWLQPLTYLIPLRYFLFISKGLFLKDLPFSIVLNHIYPMLIIGAVTLSISVLFFKWRVNN